MATFTIGKLAELLNTNTVTIRYYEKCKLIPTSIRSSGGHRLYPEAIVPRLRFIQNAKAVGFSLEEIEELLKLQENKKGSSKQIKNRMLAKLKVINEKLQSLHKIQQALEGMVASCDGKGTIDECPILGTLNKNVST